MYAQKRDSSYEQSPLRITQVVDSEETRRLYGKVEAEFGQQVQAKNNKMKQDLEKARLDSRHFMFTDRQLLNMAS